jgi:hypothetical protein
VAGDGAEHSAAGRGGGEQAAADRGEREQRDDQAVARPTPPPRTPPARVGVSCFLVIFTFPSARRSTTAAS